MGLRKVSTFVTASALLAAVLSVSAQLWVAYPLDFLRPEKQPPDPSVWQFFGLAWTCSSVLLALIAIAWVLTLTVFRKPHERTPDLSLALFMGALEMGILNVLQLIWWNADRFLQKPATGPGPNTTCLLGYVGALIFLLLGCCWLGVQKHARRRIIGWVLNGVVVGLLLWVVLWLKGHDVPPPLFPGLS